jgi:hypothetical protein|eukprot:COSAG02_NODE_1075_length_14754_cov_18.686796_8_plen_54_part_00
MEITRLHGRQMTYCTTRQSAIETLQRLVGLPSCHTATYLGMPNSLALKYWYIC